MRPAGRIIAYTLLSFSNSSSISRERLVSVDANSRRGGFLPAAPKFCGFGPSLPPQNAMNYTTLPANKKPPPKIGRGHPPIHQQTPTTGASPLSPLNGMEHKPIDQQASQPCMIAKPTIIFHLVGGKDRQAQLQRPSCRLGVV